MKLWRYDLSNLAATQFDREVVEEEGKLGEVLYWMRSGGVESKQHQVMACTVLYCTVLYCIVLCCTVLYCTVLYR